VVPNASDPGETGALPRPHSEAPPIVPHAIADFLPITQESNLCVDCHAVEEKVVGEPTPIPASHYTDMRATPDQVGDTLVGARYSCVLCHVPLTEAKPLVVNAFEVPAD
jgi:cytochrome c-type protein NapB